jgi:hypothetical protein
MILGRCFSVYAAIGAIFLFGCGKKSDSSIRPSKPLDQRVKSVVSPLVEHGWARGLIVGIVQQGREQIFSFGDIGDETGVASAPDTVFEIGSISQTGVVLWANTQVGGVIGSMSQLFDVVAASVLNVTLNAAPIEAEIPMLSPVDDEILEDYVGYYEPDNGQMDPSFPVRVEGGKLMMEGPGGIPTRLWHTEKDVFFLRAYKSSLRFQRSETGEVTGVLLDIEGQHANLVRRPLPVR